MVSVRTTLCALVGVVALAAAATLAGERGRLAEVTLKSGLTLRGRVVQTETHVVLSNELGAVRLPRDDVLSVDYVEGPATAPADGDSPPSNDADSTAPRSRGPKLPLAPNVSRIDLQRLRLHELALDGPAEPVKVQFDRRGRQRELWTEVLDAMHAAGERDESIEKALRSGTAAERLQAIVRASGATHLDRFQINSDPEVFSLFRRRVLPLINATCARSSCHGGGAAQAFRMPVGGRTSDVYAYSTFALFDAMRTTDGLLIDRENAENSLLLTFMLPRTATDRPHPETERPVFTPAIKSPSEDAYVQVVEWLEFLSKPRPEYGLDYRSPYERVGAAAGTAPADGAPAETSPAAPPAEREEAEEEAP